MDWGVIMILSRECLKNSKRIVIKVGSSTLTHNNGLLNLRAIEHLVRQIADIHNKGIDVILVSSGAIAAGMGKLGLNSRPKSMPAKQACASVGQLLLMHMYEKIFSEYGIIISQILLTKEDMEDEVRSINARNTFDSLCDMRVIPIVNENDAVVTHEIMFGDNDTLSAKVCRLIHGDLLILMSDIEGLFDSNPKIDSNAKLISLVNKIDESILKCAGDSTSKVGTGGMITKLKAAQIVSEVNSAMIIVDGSVDGILYKVLDGENVGTLFTS